MSTEPHPGATHCASFYATPRGRLARRLLRERLALLWPDLDGQSLLGLGYAAPYLGLWQERGARAVACLADAPPPHAGRRLAWPPGRPTRSCAAEHDALPFPDLAFDRVLLVHALEASENARRTLREVWRVLRDDGRLLVVAPNRVGLWAQSEQTPFGHGQPYSPGQMTRLLAASLFRVERRDAALWLPPVLPRAALRSGAAIERAGRRLLPNVAGLVIAEAVKDAYAALPLAPVARRRLALADAK